MKSKITLGSDPELLLVDNGTQQVVSALRIFKRNKHDPIELGDGIKMYPDNVLMEASFPPSSSVEDTMAMIRKVFVRMHEAFGGKYSLLGKAAYIFPKEELLDKACWESGCNPNYDVYAEAINNPADFTSGLRTGSFHIHIGDERLSAMDDKGAAIRLLDIFLGCASVIFDKDETALARRALYGRAGEFRPTPYGIEYRVLGNWALGSKELTQLVFDIVEHTMGHFNYRKDTFKAVDPLKVQTAINTNDAAMAKRILMDAAIPHKLMSRIEKEYSIPGITAAWAI